MSFISNNNNLRLLARNEGKIKTYESCSDLRAWSHDLQVRDKYLKEWIKCDMPSCVIPISTLINLLRTMTCKSRRRATPQCHPDCKSKILLESICASCRAMKESLKNKGNLSKYFVEEEFETSQWPCERCLEALKSIKMFWKIIIEKIFNVNICKQATFENCNNYRRVDSVKTLAKVWQDEIIDQTTMLEKLSPVMSIYDNLKQTKDFTEELKNTDCLANKKPSRKVNRCTSIRIKMADVDCDACSLTTENEKIQAYKTNIEYLQDNCNRQKNEMEILRRENISLKIDLQNAHRRRQWKPVYFAPDVISPDDGNETLVPTPNIKENVLANSTKEIESEMTITLKNCKNENFKHVTLMQVLHKTNTSVPNKHNYNGPGCNDENPIDLLTRVHKAFGDIVRRELSIASDRKQRTNKFDVEATFHRVGAHRSTPFCTSETNYSASSLSV